MTRKTILTLIGIVLIGATIRTWDIQNTPSGFLQDEVTNAYIGRFVLENGRDLYGNTLPIFFFNKQGDYPPIIPMYISALGTYVFGTNELGARMPGALLGILSIFLIYYISHELYGDNKIALFSALIFALSPWHVSFSRTATEGTIALAVFLAGLYCLLRWKRSERMYWFISSLLLWLCTYLLYPSYRIFVPLVYITALFVGIKGSRKIQAPLFFGLILSLFLAFAISRTPWGIGRFNQTSIVAPYASSQNPTTRYIYNESNVFTARIFNNKAVFIFRDFLKEYGEYFSLRFLIGDSGLPFWYAIPQTGTTFLIVCFLLLISIFNRHSYRNKNFALVLGLLFAAAVPAALTNEATPNLHRSLAMSALIPIVAAGAIAQISMCKWAKYYFVIISVCIFIESAFFLHNYFQHINNFSIAYRGGGGKETAQYIVKNQDAYDAIYVPKFNWFSIYYLYFSNKFDDALVGKFNLHFEIPRIENVFFTPQDCYDEKTIEKLSSQNGIKHLFITTCENPAASLTLKDIIYLSNRMRFAYVYED